MKQVILCRSMTETCNVCQVHMHDGDTKCSNGHQIGKKYNTRTGQIMELAIIKDDGTCSLDGSKVQSIGTGICKKGHRIGFLYSAR